MKMKITQFLLGASIFAAGIGYTSAQKIDDQSKKILDAVTKQYNSKSNNYFKFTLGTGINGTVTKTETGYYFASGDKYLLKILGSEQIYDGNKIYNINTEDQEVTVAKPNANSAMFSPINYLTTYRKDYNVTYSGKKKVNGVDSDFIRLTPVKANGLKEVLLFIDSKNNKMVKLEQHGSNKDVAVIAIKEYKENQKLDSNLFKFDKNKYKNYIVTEL